MTTYYIVRPTPINPLLFMSFILKILDSIFSITETEPVCVFSTEVLQVFSESVQSPSLRTFLSIFFNPATKKHYWVKKIILGFRLCILVSEGDGCNMIKKYLQETYHMSNYEIAHIIFLFETSFSELSKMVIIGILFHKHLGVYLFALCIMLYLRVATGGLHFYTYLACLTISALYISLAVLVLPQITLPSRLLPGILLISILICYQTGPVVSSI